MLVPLIFIKALIKFKIVGLKVVVHPVQLTDDGRYFLKRIRIEFTSYAVPEFRTSIKPWPHGWIWTYGVSHNVYWKTSFPTRTATPQTQYTLYRIEHFPVSICTWNETFII